MPDVAAFRASLIAFLYRRQPSRTLAAPSLVQPNFLSEIRAGDGLRIISGGVISLSPAHALPTRFASVRRQAKNWKQSPSMWESIRSEPRWKRSAKALAVVRPMPEPAPVTRAT